MRLFLTLTLILATVGISPAGPRASFSRAKTPSSEELNRANLMLTWTISLPMLGTRDSIATVQLIPVPDPIRKGEDRVLLVVQLRSGTIAVYDAESGRKLWSKQPPPAFPVSIPEVAYDPRGALIVVRDNYLYRFDLFRPTTSTGSTDEIDNLLAVMPTFPSTTPVVVVSDVTRPNDAIIIVCFNDNRLLVYGKAFEDRRVRPDDTVLDWKVKYSDDIDRVSKPGDNKSPSLAVVRSVFGPDYGLKSRSIRPEPPYPSLAVIRNLSRPNEFSSRIASSPSLTLVNNLSRLGEYSQRDARGPSLDATTRRGDALDFRIGQRPELVRGMEVNLLGQRTSSLIPKLVLVGTQRDVQIDSVSERDGLRPERRLNRRLFRSDFIAPAAFKDKTMIVPTQDGTVYAVDSDFGLVQWMASLSSPAMHTPAVIGQQVFVTTRFGRLFALSIDSGMPTTGGSFADDGSFPYDQVRKFLATSDRYVFAIDDADRLVVFDRKRGSRQGFVDITGFTVTYLNDVTDRVLLGSNDGKLICLQDRNTKGQLLYRRSRLSFGGQKMNGDTANPTDMNETPMPDGR